MPSAHAPFFLFCLFVCFAFYLLYRLPKPPLWLFVRLFVDVCLLCDRDWLLSDDNDDDNDDCLSLSLSFSGSMSMALESPWGLGLGPGPGPGQGPGNKAFFAADSKDDYTAGSGSGSGTGGGSDGTGGSFRYDTPMQSARDLGMYDHIIYLPVYCTLYA